MKTERRHELQTNVLADWLGKKVAVIQPYAKSIAAVGLLLLAAFLAYTVISGTQTSRLASAWNEYFSAFGQRDPDLLARVAESEAYQGTVAGLWARQSMADIELANGSAQLYQDRDAAAEALDRAAEGFESVRNEAGNHPMLRRRATFGLAQAHEFLSVLTKNEDKIQDHLGRARSLYEEIARSSPGTAIARMADERLRLINNLSGQAGTGEGREEGAETNWYQWLANQELPPPSMGGQGMPGDFGLGGGTPRVGTDTMPSGPPREPLPNMPTLETPFPLDDDATPETEQSPATPDNGEAEQSPAAPDNGETEKPAEGDSPQPPGDEGVKPPGGDSESPADGPEDKKSDDGEPGPPAGGETDDS